jgi:hypothetical protein
VTTLPNPAHPLVGIEIDFTQGPPNTPGSNRRSINAPYRKLQVQSISTDRGRQYELDQATAGQCTLQVIDPLELLHPDNGASPFNTGSNIVTPYRCIWVWAIWPVLPTSGNIISTTVNGSYDPSFESGTGNWTVAGGTTTAATSTAQHFDGSKSLLVTQSAAGAGFGVTNIFRTAPAITYTFSCYVYATGGCSVTVQVTDALGGVHTASTSVQTTWTRLSVTWDCVDTLETVAIFGTGTSTPTFYVDATALHFGPTAQTFGTTGPTWSLVFTGYVERWPTTYDMAGTRALRPLQAVDAIALLAITEIAQSYQAVALADNPGAYLPFEQQKAPNSGTFAVGTRAIFNPIGFQSATGQVQWGGDQQPDGSPALVLQQNNSQNPPVRGHNSLTYPIEQQTAFDTMASNGSLLNTGSTVECWAKFSSGVALFMQLLQTTTGGFTTELGYGASSTQHHLEMYTGGGRLGFQFHDAVAGFTAFLSLTSDIHDGYPDGQWHYYAITMWNNAGAPALAFTYDTHEITVAGPSGVRYYGYTNLHHEATTDFGDTQSQVSIARMAVYSTNIGATRRQARYQRGVGYIGEQSGARVTRLLAQYWGGATSVAAGFINLSEDFDYNTRFVLDVLQEIQDTERGLVYVSRTGVVVFEDRSSRYATQTATATFGENTAGGEVPYEDYGTDHDPTYTFSQANLTRPGNANFLPMINTTTAAKYGARVLQQDVKVTNDADLTQAGIFYLQRYGTPKTRISKLGLHPAAYPAMWPTVLGLEISQRVTVKRRTAITTSADYYVEKVSHRIDAQSGGWTVELQASPVFVPSAWVLGDATYGVLGSTTTPIY